MKKADREILQAVPMFTELDTKELDRLVEVAHREAYQKGEVIFLENEPGESLYVVVDGKVNLTVSTNEGKETLLSHVLEGEFFGEMALLDKETRSASASAGDSTELLVITQKAFMELLKKDGGIALAVAKTLSHRLRKATSRILSLSLLDAQSRVGHLLGELAREQGQTLLDGSVVLERPPTQQMASMLGTTRETVSRAIHGLEDQGFLKINGRTLLILGLED